MDYTANHHLPQWEKSDRIMMDDFNAAMADIEAGLNQVQDSSDGGFESVELNMDRLRAVLSDIARDAYRRAVAQRIASGSAGSWDSMWINCLYSKEEVGESWSGGYGIHFNSAAPTVAGITNSATKIDYISLVPTYTYQSRRAAIQFTSDGDGVLQSVSLVTEAQDYTTTDFTFHITMKKADTGEVLAQAGPFVTEHSDNSSSYFWREVNFPLSAGVRYELEFFAPENSGWRRVLQFKLANNRGYGDVNSILLAPWQPGSTVITKTVTPPDWAGAATGLVRWAGTGSVTLSVNGQALAAGQTRSCLNAQGKSCQETEFPLDTLPAGPLTVTAAVTQGAGAMSLFDYGLLWR